MSLPPAAILHAPPCAVPGDGLSPAFHRTKESIGSVKVSPETQSYRPQDICYHLFSKNDTSFGKEQSYFEHNQAHSFKKIKALYLPLSNLIF